MIKVLSKPKRGAEFIDLIHNTPVWLYRIKDDNKYIVCNEKSFGIESNFFEANPSDLRLAVKLRSAIATSSKKLTAEEKKVKDDLNEFYRLAAFDAPLYCQECGEPLDCYNEWDLRCCTAHILPKSKNNSGFPSIACHPINKLFLGKKNCYCHDQYDQKGAEFRSKMKIYPVVLAAYEILKEELTEPDIVRANKYLNIK